MRSGQTQPRPATGICAPSPPSLSAAMDQLPKASPPLAPGASPCLCAWGRHSKRPPLHPVLSLPTPLPFGSFPISIPTCYRFSHHTKPSRVKPSLDLTSSLQPIPISLLLFCTEKRGERALCFLGPVSSLLLSWTCSLTALAAAVLLRSPTTVKLPSLAVES